MSTNTWDRIKRSKYGIIAGAFLAVAIGLSDFTESLDKILIYSGFRSSALELKGDDLKSSFSRDFTRMAWHRLFWTRRMLVALKYSYNENQKERTWESYLNSVENWNKELMLFITYFEKFYGSEKRGVFEHQIQGKFAAMHYCIERIYQVKPEMKCGLLNGSTIQDIQLEVEKLNSKLYCFVSALDPAGNTCELVRSN